MNKADALAYFNEASTGDELLEVLEVVASEVATQSNN